MNYLDKYSSKKNPGPPLINHSHFHLYHMMESVNTIKKATSLWSRFFLLIMYDETNMIPNKFGLTPMRKMSNILLRIAIDFFFVLRVV